MTRIILLILIFILGLFNYSHAQELTQTVRGTIIDKQSRAPIEFATVIVVDSDPFKGTTADENGVFRLEGVKVGRITIQVSSVGYITSTIPNIVVNSGKETILNFELEEEIKDLKAVTISGKKDEPSDLSTVSAKVLTIDQTNRYAGSLGDPSRMVANFAGINGGNDQRNDIIIRGNSPLGVLWRLEGADIPNPNHFAGNGTTGGPVSILNNNLLANSDFMTGAFPSPYGNALSGAFDLKLRSGNNEKREYTGQIGFNGFEFGAEGPLNISKGSSYLISYRYSTLDALNEAGVSFGEGTGIPRFQDLTFKLDYPKSKLGKISIFGIGGISSTEIFDSKNEEIDSLQAQREDIDFKSRMGVLGITHSYQISKKTFVRTVITQSYASSTTLVDTLTLNNDKFETYFQEAADLKTAINSYINKKVNAKNTFRLGFILTRMATDMKDRFYDDEQLVYFTRIDINEGTSLGQGYANWQYKPNNRLTLNTGLHYMHFFLNNSTSVEPRFNARYQLNDRQNISFGMGIHSQTQPLSVYFTRDRLPGGNFNETNKDLGFTKSQHYIMGYSRSLTPNITFKTEVYYQALYDIPVERHSSSYSLANFGADFGIPLVDSLVNNGTGSNYGIEVTLERYYNKGYYFLVTGSLFESKYKGSDGVERNTAFNGNYVFNALFGKEFKLKNNKVLNINIKQNGAGGRRFVPIDVELSKQTGSEERDETRAYEGKYADYFRTDIKFGIKKNRENYTSEWGIEIQNVLNRRNILTQQYNPYTQKIEDVNQLRIFPIGYYRINF